MSSLRARTPSLWPWMMVALAGLAACDKKQEAAPDRTAPAPPSPAPTTPSPAPAPPVEISNRAQLDAVLV